MLETDSPPEGIAPYSDEDIAQRLEACGADNLRYTAALNRWSFFQNGVWLEDKTLRVYDLAREICREASAEVDPKSKVAQDLNSAKKVAAAVTLARVSRRIAAVLEQWDSDPWRLNTPAGTVDLRTGEMFWSRPEYYHSKITGAAPGGECPIWHAFLDRVTGGNVQLQLYLQRLAGYILTGSTREHVFVFCYGPGANGKSVWISTLSRILGSYATTAPIETFIASHTDRHPTDLAGLRGARLVTAVETESGRRWAESKLKMMTGGDRISARFMRQDFFEYTPAFKLLIAGNHRPGLRNIDEAIRRRLHIVPFTVTIPEDERDEELSDKLRDEWPGILAWAIEGAREWLGEGLAPPDAVRRATEDYLATEDSLGQWLQENTYDDPDPVAWTGTSALFEDWKLWAERGCERPGNVKQFTQAMVQRGYRREARRDGRGFLGIRLNPARP